MKTIKNRQIDLNYSFSLYTLIRRAIVTIVIIVLAFLLFRNNSKYEELLELNEVASEELQLTRNKNGELVARIGAFETRDSKDFENYKTTDSLILALQAEVKENRRVLKKQGSVTQFSTEGEAQTTSGTNVSTDTNGDPVYTSKFDLDGWVFGSSVATKDSTFYDIGYKDKYSIVIGQESQGFLGLGKSKPFAQITSSNPYNTVKTLKTYQVSLPEKKNFSIAPSVNYGIDLTGRQTLSVGLSLQYNKASIKF